MIDTRPKMPCNCCGDPTPMIATGLCDACWEIEHRMGHRMDKVRWHNAKLFLVEVTPEGGPTRAYSVYAPSEYDARVMAFSMACAEANRSWFMPHFLDYVNKHTRVVRE